MPEQCTLGKLLLLGGLTPPSRKNELLLEGVNPPFGQLLLGGGVNPPPSLGALLLGGVNPPQPREAYCSSVPYWDPFNKF